MNSTEQKMKMHKPAGMPLTISESSGLRGTQFPSGLHSTNSRNFRVSLKQWKMFHAVVDFDGFTGAASHLHISQSAISYTLAKLQEQLGISLLKLEGRKARITEEGKILLDHSRELVRNAIELEALAENLRQGWGPKISIAVDPGFPSQLLMLALRKLSPSLQNIRLSVEEATPEQAKKALHERMADLAISTLVPQGFIGNELIQIEYVPVAHPNHPLFALEREITMDDLEKQLQIIIASSSEYVSGDAGRQLSRYSRLWNVTSFDTALGALQHGLGYAWLPRYRAQRWIQESHIRILPLNNGGLYKTSLYLIFGRSAATESGARRFADALYSLAANGISESGLELS